MNRCPSCSHPEKFHHLCGVPQACDYEADPTNDEQCGCTHYLAPTITRTEAEALFGPVKVAHVFPPIPSRSFDYEAYFDDLLDLGMPNWARASGSTEEEALTELLTQAAEHHAEREQGDNGESEEWRNGMDLLGRNL